MLAGPARHGMFTRRSVAMILLTTMAYRRRLPVLFLIVCSIQVARADPGKPIGARRHMTHLSSDKWLAEYESPKPGDNIHFDRAGAYRSQAWLLLTPGLTLETHNNQEVITAGYCGRSLSPAWGMQHGNWAAA